jgi:hypothetical protein
MEFDLIYLPHSAKLMMDSMSIDSRLTLLKKNYVVYMENILVFTITDGKKAY